MSQVTVYKWRIPKYTESQLNTIFITYIQNISNKHVPIDIINLCIQFFQDCNILNKMKDVKPGDGFYSNYFDVANCNWCIDIYPNSSDTELGGEVDIFLSVESIAPNISQIHLEYNIQIVDVTNHKGMLDIFDDEENEQCWNTVMTTDEFKKIPAKQITIKLEIFSVHIVNKENDKKVIANNKIIERPLLPSASNTWIVSQTMDINNIKTATNCM